MRFENPFFKPTYRNKLNNLLKRFKYFTGEKLDNNNNPVEFWELDNEISGGKRNKDTIPIK